MSTDPLADLVGHAQAIITIANDAATAAGTIQERTPRLNPTDRHNIIAALVDTIDDLHRDHHDPRRRPAERLSIHQRATALAATLATFTNHTERRPSLLPATWNDCANDPLCTYLDAARRRANHDAYIQCLINADTLANTPPDNTPAPADRYSITDVTWTVTPRAGDRPGYLTGHLHGAGDIHHNIDETEFAAAGWRYIQALAWAINYNHGLIG